MPKEESNDALAEKFADFFLSKIDKIRESLKDCECFTQKKIKLLNVLNLFGI